MNNLGFHNKSLLEAFYLNEGRGAREQVWLEMPNRIDPVRWKLEGLSRNRRCSAGVASCHLLLGDLFHLWQTQERPGVGLGMAGSSSEEIKYCIYKLFSAGGKNKQKPHNPGSISFRM